MGIQIQAMAGLGEISALLQACGLPVEDLAQTPHQVFFGMHKGAALVAVVGLELYDTVALLRSLAVSPAMRGRGLGRHLVSFAERYAEQRGIAHLYLLTETAGGYFAALGYGLLDRADAPPAIRNTAQFSGLCPATAAFMVKNLA